MFGTTSTRRVLLSLARRRRRPISINTTTIQPTSPICQQKPEPVLVANTQKEWHEEPWIHTLDRLQRSCVTADFATYASLIRQCGKAKALSEASRIHALILQSGHARDRVLANLLVQMYGKCGALEDARAIFVKMHPRNVFSWSIMVTAYCEAGQLNEALRLFQQMQLDGVAPNKVTYLSILSACATQTAKAEGKWMHSQIVGSGLESDVTVGTALVNMYSKCGSLDDAERMFDKMPQRDVVSWNTMITAYTRNGQPKAALELFQVMQVEGLIPDKVTFVSILDACASHALLDEGKQVHTRIIYSGADSDAVVENALVNMYGKCGSLKDARRTFDKMVERDIVSWNAIIAAYAQHNQGKEAIELFQQMMLEGVMPNKVTFVGILSALSGHTSLAEGKRIHSFILQSGLEADVVVGTALVSMYGKCGSLEDARRVFDIMPERNVVSWNALITTYVQHGQGKEALKLFKLMGLEGTVPNNVTFISILDACASQKSLTEGKKMHADIASNGFELDTVLGNALVHMYAKCGSLEDAQKIFSRIPQRDVVSWNSMIAAFTQHGQDNEAHRSFQQMQQEGVIPDKITFASILSTCVSQAALAKGKLIHAQILGRSLESDVGVGNALVNMYGKCGCLEDARRMFDKMHERDVFSWNAMIGAYAQHEHGSEAIQLFQRMQLEGPMPDNVTFVCILDACACEAALVEGKQIHTSILGSGYGSDIVVANALLNMYGKCGSLENAWKTFDKISEPNVVSWTSMIAVYAQHGHGREALQIYDQMLVQGVIPNEVTFISVLSACSHTGLVDEGCHFFVSMRQDHGMIPTLEHYNCMIDLHGRAGRLDEGEYLIHNMPFPPTATSWMSLLGACKMHFDVERGKRAAEHVSELDGKNAAPSLLLSRLYVAAGKWDDAAEMRKRIKGNACD